MPSEFAARVAEFLGVPVKVPLDAVVILEYLDETGRHRMSYNADDNGVVFHQIGLCEAAKARLATRLREEA